jgi:hypothetical protein
MSDPITPIGTPRPVVAPVVDPVVAPVEAPVVEPIVAPVDAPAKLDLEPVVVKATVTGNKAFDDVASLLADKGVNGVDEMFKSIAANGEVALTDSAKIIAALGETVGNMVINSMVQETANIKTAASAKSQVTMDYAATKFGEPEKAAEVWTAIQEFAKSPESGLTPEDRKAMTKMLRAGGLQAEMVIDRLYSRFENADNYTQPADLVAGDSTSNAGFTPLSASDYSTELRGLVEKHGYESTQVEALQTRRLASKKAGY